MANVHIFILLLSMITIPAGVMAQEINTSLDDQVQTGVLASEKKEIKGPYSNLNKILDFSSDQSAIVKINYTQKIQKNSRLKMTLKKKSQQEGFNLIVKDVSPDEKIILKEMNIEWDINDGEYFTLNGEYYANFSKNSILLPEIKIYDELLLAHQNPVQGSFNIQGYPDLNHSYFYKNAFAVGNEPKYCNIRSPWILASRTVEYLPDGVLVKDSVNFIKREFTPAEVLDESFIATSNQFQKCFKDNILHLSFESKKHLVVTQKFEEEIANLPLQEKIGKRIDKVKEISASCDKSNGMHEEMMRILLERNLAEDPTSLPSYQFLVYYYQSTASVLSDATSKHNYDEAMKYIDKALSYDPEFTEALVSKVMTLCILGRCEEGKKILHEKLLTKNVENFSYYALRGIRNYYELTGDKTNMEKFEDYAFQKADTKYERAETFKRMGVLAYRKGDMDSCVKYYNRAIEADEDSSCLHSNLAYCHFGQRNYPMAVFSFQNALSRYENWYFRYSLAKVYYYQAKEFEMAKDRKSASELYTKSFDVLSDWKAAIEMLKFYIEIRNFDFAYKAALKAANLYEDDPKKLAGYIIHAFPKKDLSYSKFLEKIISDIKDRFNANELAYYIAHSLQHEPNTVQHWVNISVKDLTNIKYRPEDIDSKVKTNILISKFYLLNLSLSRKVSDLDKANYFYEIAAKLLPRDKEVLQHAYYVETANRALGKGRVFWETRLSLEKNLGITLPLWMLYWLYY